MGRGGRVKYIPVDKKLVDAAFGALKSCHGSHGKVARSLGLPLRTYYDWRKRGIPGPIEESLIIEKAKSCSCCEPTEENGTAIL